MSWPDAQKERERESFVNPLRTLLSSSTEKQARKINRSYWTHLKAISMCYSPILNAPFQGQSSVTTSGTCLFWSSSHFAVQSSSVWDPWPQWFSRAGPERGCRCISSKCLRSCIFSVFVGCWKRVSWQPDLGLRVEIIKLNKLWITLYACPWAAIWRRIFSF